ncbi:MAG TPA: phosphotransferase [Candidatus Baltobacteraceae bacterium]|jgi:homoserine kinase type II|nr:phosphotransferase [Candidatus Baltobacteraceae bacterium]
MSNPIPVDDPALAKIAKVLTNAYGLREDVHLTRLNIGQGTFNYRALTQGRSLFIKHYQAGDDLVAEAEAVALTRLAGDHGVPVAEVLRSTAGEAISRQGDTAVSVWTWMSGHTITGGFNQAQHAAAGQTLGRIHHTFADHPAGKKPSSELHDWLNPDLTQL